MNLHRLAAACLVTLAAALPGRSGEIYRVTSTDGKKTITDEVTFGGGKSSGKITAFCPRLKKFVYLTWALDDEGKNAPQPASFIWDSRTGRTTPLYRFPDCPDPLPSIGGIEDLRVCPFTGDKKLEKERSGFAD